MARKLDPSAVREALVALPGWSLAEDGRSITRTFTFADFSEAFAFMARAALAAEKADHHPDWSNSYGTVVVTLSTHSAGGVTDNDIALASAMNGFAV